MFWNFSGLHINYHSCCSVYGNKSEQKEENKQTRYSLILCQDQISILSSYSNVYTRKSVSKSFVNAVILNTRFCVFVFLCARSTLPRKWNLKLEKSLINLVFFVQKLKDRTKEDCLHVYDVPKIFK